jgi:hypothetical protein
VGSICRKASPTHRRYYRLVHVHGPSCNIESRLSLGSTWCRDIRLRVGVAKSRRRLVKGERTVNTSELRRAKRRRRCCCCSVRNRCLRHLGWQTEQGGAEGVETRHILSAVRYPRIQRWQQRERPLSPRLQCAVNGRETGDAGSRLSSGRYQSASRDTRHVLLQPPSVAKFHPHPETQ